MYGNFGEMWIWILLFGVVVSIPSDEFRRFISEGELTQNDDSRIMQIVPSGYSPHRVTKDEGIQLPDFVDKNFPYYKKFVEFAKEGFAMKGLTFNLYDDNMRETAISLFRILQNIKPEDVAKLKEWVKYIINMDIFDYALRLAAVYGNKDYQKELEPPFIFKPNYFINSETILKGLRLKLNNGRFHAQEAKTNQFNISDDFTTLKINTNYSGWNLPIRSCEELTNYFREDIGLNSYYYGIHLLHPFWMSSDELDKINPRHAEHYYYLHRQLLARYLLEKEHLTQGNISTIIECDRNYFPYLVYENGLAFPNRPSLVKEHNEARAAVQSIDIAINEFLSRRLIMLDNGTFVKITEDNYLQLLPKLLRANLDSARSAKIIRALYGNGGGPLIARYTPAPSVLHHPQTSLRDHAYWDMIERALNYSLQFINTLKPYNITQYDTDQFRIVEEHIDNITTFFDYYELSINRALGNDEYVYNSLLPRTISARQRRLKHMPFTFKFKVKAFSDKKVIIRLFLGPQCSNITCWSLFDRFFELDSYKSVINSGSNLIVWSSENSSRISFDYFNTEHHDPSKTYNVFKFPQRLLIPKGLEEGLNLTLFISITPYEETAKTEEFSSERKLYNEAALFNELDEKPLGFPFHRLAAHFENSNFNSYRFYNITVFHKKGSVDPSGVFSPHLY